jgi:hypothetical protein
METNENTNQKQKNTKQKQFKNDKSNKPKAKTSTKKKYYSTNKKKTGSNKKTKVNPENTVIVEEPEIYFVDSNIDNFESEKMEDPVTRPNILGADENYKQQKFMNIFCNLGKIFVNLFLIAVICKFCGILYWTWPIVCLIPFIPFLALATLIFSLSGLIYLGFILHIIFIENPSSFINKIKLLFRLK